jgi:hypothetical protein
LSASWAAAVGGDERQVDLRRVRAGELALGALRGLLEPLQGHPVAAQVDAGLRLEVLDQPVHDALVEVLAAEVGVARGGAHLEHPLGELEDRDIERAAAQIINGDVGPLLDPLQAIGESGGRGLVDDAQDFQAGDLARVLGRLALGVVEVGRNGDHRVADRLAQGLLHELLDLAQHLGRDLLGAVLPVADLDLDVAVRGLDQSVGEDLPGAGDLGIGELAADQALDREDRVLGVGDRLALGDLADEPVPLLREGDDGGGGAAPLAVRQHARHRGLHDGRAGVGRAQVDAEDLAQRKTSLNVKLAGIVRGNGTDTRTSTDRHRQPRTSWFFLTVFVRAGPCPSVCSTPPRPPASSPTARPP